MKNLNIEWKALSDRLQTLLDQKKVDTLTTAETIELATIGELDDIFSYINATLAASRPEVFATQLKSV